MQKLYLKIMERKVLSPQNFLIIMFTEKKNKNPDFFFK